MSFMIISFWYFASTHRKKMVKKSNIRDETENKWKMTKTNPKNIWNVNKKNVIFRSSSIELKSWIKLLYATHLCLTGIWKLKSDQNCTANHTQNMAEMKKKMNKKKQREMKPYPNESMTWKTTEKISKKNIYFFDSFFSFHRIFL